MASDTAERSEQKNQLSSSKELHTSFGFIIGLMLTLVGVKYQGSGTTLFKEHSLMVSIFVMFILVYAIALVKMTLDDHHNSNSVPTYYATTSHQAYTYIFLISGTLACELLLYVLVTPLVWFLIINAFMFIFAGVLCRSCHQHINEPLLTVSSDEVADREPVCKLHELIKQVILCRSSAPLDHTTRVEHDHTECDPLAYLGLNRMRGLFKQIYGRLCSAPASTASVDEGQREVQMPNIV